MIDHPPWPVVLAISILWLLCFCALLWCCVRDLVMRSESAASEHEHPIHALYRRNSKEDDGLTDILAEEDIDYHAMHDPAYQSPFDLPTSPPPRRPAYAAASTTPTAAGASSSRPIRAWSVAADWK